MYSRMGSQFSSMEDYANDLLEQLDNPSDGRTTTLRIHGFYYPFGVTNDASRMGYDDSRNFLSSQILANLLDKVRISPHVKSLDLRFLDFTDDVSSVAFRRLFLDDKSPRHWASITVSSCSGFDQKNLEALAFSLQNRCQALYWYDNKATTVAHLKILGQALATSTTLQSLSISREDFKDSHRIQAFLGDLHHNVHLRRLCLNFCKFHNHELPTALANMLSQTTSSLQELDLAACYLKDAQVECIVTALEKSLHYKDMNSTLETLVLCMNKGCFRATNAIGRFIQHPKCSLKNLNMSRQTFGSTFMYLDPIVDALIVNTNLRSLKLSRNRLTIKGIALLLKNLEKNSTLRELDLNGNLIEDDAANAISSCLQLNSGLEKIDLQNNLLKAPETGEIFLHGLQSSSSHVLKVLEIRPTLPQSPQINYELALNASGRRALKSTIPIPAGLWPLILGRHCISKECIQTGTNEKAKPLVIANYHHHQQQHEQDSLYYMLKNANTYLMV